MVPKNNKKGTTKQLAMRKTHANKFHTKFFHCGEYMMWEISKHLHYIVKGKIEVCEELPTEKIKQKFLDKWDLNPGKMICIDISSQKNPSYVGSKNWILIQDSDTKHKCSFFTKAKDYLTEKVSPLLKKMKTTKKNIKIILCDWGGEEVA